MIAGAHRPSVHPSGTAFALVLAALCFGRPAYSEASTPDTSADSPSPPEIGVLSDAPVGLPWRGPLDQEIEFGLSALIPTEDDISAIYGGVPVAQARLSVRIGRQSQFFLGGGYGRAHGDPYYDQPSFEAADEAELTVVPVQMGVRINLLPRDEFRLNLGFLMEAVWLRERLPVGELGDPEPWRSDSGWTRGIGVTFGPEWRSRNLRRAVGFEAGLTGNGGTIGKAPERDANLTGMSGRLYFSTRI